MRPLALFLMTVAMGCAASRHSFEVSQAGEMVAELELSSPGADWKSPGREAAVAVLRVAGRPDHHLIVPSAGTYRVFLGKLNAGKHELTIERDERHSAKGAALEVHGVRVHRPADAAAVANAPVIFARRNTIGRFSDVPLLAYVERLQEDGRPLLQYTIMFSNEDGGTSTRALMARWGRTTDIEYVARVYLNADGSPGRTIVQGPGHKDVEFKGAADAAHALLMPVTDNNMIAEAAGSSLRFQLAPILVDLTTSSREAVMDSNPMTYELMSKELEREGKFRKFGTVEAENISDVRNYAIFEYKASHKNSAFGVQVLLKDGRAFSSDLGRIDYAISRDGWVRTTVELPPGTEPAAISQVAFTCLVPPPSERGAKMAHSGVCHLEQVSKAFFLTQDYKPGKLWLSVSKAVTVPTGQSVLFQP